MQYSEVNGVKVSRLALGTKRFPTEDSSRVVHMDKQIVGKILEKACDLGINLFDTTYSNHKGEAEAFLGEELSQRGDASNLKVSTSFFEMVDPRFEYVFQKQLKKLERECIDFYCVEGITDINKEVNITSGAIDYLFKQKEAGKISQLGFSSDLSVKNIQPFLDRYPWDFVRMKISFYDWFIEGVKEKYQAFTDAGVPIIAHGSFRLGPLGSLKQDAIDILKEARPELSSIKWALMFVKSLENVRSVSCNVYSLAQLEEDASVFEDDAVLSTSDMEVLKQASQAQSPKRPKAAVE